MLFSLFLFHGRNVKFCHKTLKMHNQFKFKFHLRIYANFIHCTCMFFSENIVRLQCKFCFVETIFEIIVIAFPLKIILLSQTVDLAPCKLYLRHFKMPLNTLSCSSYISSHKRYASSNFERIIRYNMFGIFFSRS